MVSQLCIFSFCTECKNSTSKSILNFSFNLQVVVSKLYLIIHAFSNPQEAFLTFTLCSTSRLFRVPIHRSVSLSAIINVHNYLTTPVKLYIFLLQISIHYSKTINLFTSDLFIYFFIIYRKKIYIYCT